MFKKLMLLMALVGSGSLSASLVDMSRLPRAYNPKAKSKAVKLERAIESYVQSQNKHKKSYKHIFLNLGVSDRQVEPRGLIQDCASFLMHALSGRQTGAVDSEKFDFLTERVLREGLERHVDFDYVLHNEIFSYLNRQRLVRLRSEKIVDGLSPLNLVLLPEILYNQELLQGPVSDVLARGEAIVNEVNASLVAGELFYANHLIVYDWATSKGMQSLSFTLYSGCGEMLRKTLHAQSQTDLVAALIGEMRVLNKNCIEGEKNLNQLELGQSDLSKAARDIFSGFREYGWLGRIRDVGFGSGK